MEKHGSQFLHEKDPKLHVSGEVEAVASYLRNSGELIPNEPADKITAYLGFLSNHEYVNDGILTGDQASIDRQVDARVIRAEDVPEGYFELQRRIAREQGHGDIIIDPQSREQMIEAIQADQQASLTNWVEYLGGNDGSYPDWFKYYTWTSIAKIGVFDKEKQEFQKRSRGTTAAYPELNREALAYVFDVLNTSRVHGEKVDSEGDDKKLQQLLQSANFGKLYAHAAQEVTPDSPELKKATQGSWTKFSRTDDPRTARRLSESLQGHGTGWCTASESTAGAQLQDGDFYVYYTRDEDGDDTVPRVAIRMEYGEVNEVRGINPSQELEPVMTDITSERLKELPGGEVYVKKAEDMKRLTNIEKKITANNEIELPSEELRFLYEIDREIQGFGYDIDPRIAIIRSQRDARKDLGRIFGVEFTGNDCTEILEGFIAKGNVRAVLACIPYSQSIDGSILENLKDSDEFYKAVHYFFCTEAGNYVDEKTIFAQYAAAYATSFTNINSLIAQSIIDKDALGRLNVGSVEVPLNNLESHFTSEAADIIVSKLLEENDTWWVADALPGLSNLDAKIAKRLLFAGEEDALFENIESFSAEAQLAIKRCMKDPNYAFEDID